MSQSNNTSLQPHVTKLYSIKYFVPSRSIEEANMLVQKVEELVENYEKALLTWKKDNGTLQDAADSLWDLTRTSAIKSGRINTWDSAWDYAWRAASYSARDNYGWYGGGYVSGETARDAARDAGKYAARYAVFESVKDKLGQTNPFEFIIDLYLMGLRPTYFKKINEKEKFVVDFPIKKDNKTLLGCYTYGDKEILFTHEWKEYCTNLKPTKDQS